MAGNNTTETSMVAFSQSVELSARTAFNQLVNTLESHALKNQIRVQGKGEVLSKLLKEISKKYEKDPASYFEK